MNKNMASIIRTTSLFTLMALITACAQLGLDKVKLDAKKVKDDASGAVTLESSAQDPRRSRIPTPATSAPSEKKFTTNEERNAHPQDLDIDFSALPVRPTVLWHSLLNNSVLTFNPVTGTLLINKPRVAFLPTKTASGADIPEGRVDKRDLYTWVEVFDTKSNKPVDSLFFKMNPYILPFYELERVDGYGINTQLYDGSFELRFKFAQHEYYRFPFRVQRIGNSDPYSPVKELFFLRGAWEEWGMLSYNSDKNLRFSVYTTERRVDIKNQGRPDEDARYKYLAKLIRDGKIVGVSHVESDDSKTWDFDDMRIENAHWEEFEGGFFAWPMSGIRRYFSQPDLKDGAYTIELTLQHDETKVETESTYSFVVKNGKIVPVAKADRNQNKDYLTFLEQGTEHHYIRKTK